MSKLLSEALCWQDGRSSKSTALLVKSFKKNLGITPYGPVSAYCDSRLMVAGKLNKRERACLDVHYASLQALWPIHTYRRTDKRTCYWTFEVRSAVEVKALRLLV